MNTAIQALADDGAVTDAQCDFDGNSCGQGCQIIERGNQHFASWVLNKKLVQQAVTTLRLAAGIEQVNSISKMQPANLR